MLDVDYYVDDRAGARFRGWAWLPAAPELVLDIELAAADGSIVARVAADGVRADLADAGKRDGACGFMIEVPPACPSGDYTLRARCGALALALAAPERFAASWVANAWPPRLTVPAIDDAMHAAALAESALRAGDPTGLAPADLAAIETVLATARPEILVCRGVAPGLLVLVRTLGPDRPTPDRPAIVERLDPSSDDEAIGAAERVCVLFQPHDGEAMLSDAVARHAQLVSAGGAIVILGPSSRGRSVAIHQLLATDARFVVDHGGRIATTAPLGFVRRRPDPRGGRGDDAALDDLEGV